MTAPGQYLLQGVRRGPLCFGLPFRAVRKALTLVRSPPGASTSRGARGSAELDHLRVEVYTQRIDSK